MNIEPVPWSEEKQQGLQVHLSGMWTLDTWELGGPNGKYRHIHFRLNSPSLKIEFKYAFWHKFATGERDATKQQTMFCSDAMCLFKWFNRVAPTAASLLEKPLMYWGEMREAVIRCKVASKIAENLTTDIPLNPFPSCLERYFLVQ